MKVLAHLLAADGSIPNHPRWPLLVYPAAVSLSGKDPAEIFEALFTFHHYHSNSHEVLGIYEGEVTVQFGGDAGVTVTAKPGDVIVLPAGTGHKKLASRGALGVVGAYPEGERPDTCMPALASAAKSAAAVARVPLPACDPVYGPGGPLFTYWLPQSGR
jgi:uncharacterized protein YjlB